MMWSNAQGSFLRINITQLWSTLPYAALFWMLSLLHHCKFTALCSIISLPYAVLKVSYVAASQTHVAYTNATYWVYLCYLELERGAGGEGSHAQWIPTNANTQEPYWINPVAPQVTCLVTYISQGGWQLLQKMMQHHATEIKYQYKTHKICTCVYTPWALKNLLHAQRLIYVTFGQWRAQAALHISNIRPLKVKVYCCLDGSVQSIEGVFIKTLPVKSGFLILTWTNL
jgi:hypothetical protein